MKRKSKSANLSRSSTAREMYLDELIGREVYATNGRRVGRLEEFRAERQGSDYVIGDYMIGVAGLFERLGVGFKSLFRRQQGSYVVDWRQIDISNPHRLRLTCSVQELRKI